MIAAGTDWVDGYWARKYGQVTKLGRILDPFADKIIICGTFIFLAAVPHCAGTARSPPPASRRGWPCWSSPARCSSPRCAAFSRKRGVDFSAKWAGKWKMLFQCLAVGFSLYRLGNYFDPRYPADWTSAPPIWLTYSLAALVWTAIALTIYSGWEYVRAALRMLKK